jgi:polyhydroxyalkanoate synthase
MAGAVPVSGGDAKESKDRRFSAPEWRENPIFDTIRKSYLQISDRLLGTVDEIDNVDPATREKLRFSHARIRRRDEPVQLRS